MSEFGPGHTSANRLQGACDDLKRVVMKAYSISRVDFSVIETIRSEEQQRKNIEAGVSWTMDSDHLRLHPDGSGVCAVDLYPWVDGKTSHAEEDYRLLARAMFDAAQVEGVHLKWGGFWNGKQNDKPHWYLT